MAPVNPPIVRFDGGVIGKRLHNRVDIPSYPNGAEIMQNFRPSIQGIMDRRPPLVHVDTFDTHTKKGELWPFYFNIDDTYLLLITDEGMKVYANSGEITIPTQTATLSGSYTDESTGSASISSVGDNLFLDSNGSDTAIAQRTITINEANTSHTLAFRINQGTISIRVGSTSGDDDLMLYENLRKGDHYLSFTPGATGTKYIQFFHTDNAGRILDNSASFALGIVSGNTFRVPVPWAEADLREVQLHQIKNVLYAVHEDYWPRRIERRADRSWSVTRLEPNDGPFGDLNTTLTTLTPDDTTGEITLTASTALFTANDVGVIYQMTGAGQSQSAVASAADVQTGGVKVTGIGSAERSFTIEITGTFVATVTLQRSSGNENNYTDWQTYTAATSLSIYDTFDNQTWYYRLNVKGGDYTSGTVNMTISFPGGSSTANVRVIQFNSTTEVLAEVINDTVLANTDATRTWKRGAWNNDDGYPVAITEGYGRLWFGRGNFLWASKSDDFTSFDAGEADEADLAIVAEIGTASDDGVRWLGFTVNLAVGTAAEEKIGLGNTDSEPVGPSNFQVLPSTEEGAALVQPVAAIQSMIFVHRSRQKLMQFVQNPRALSDTSYIAVDLAARSPELLEGDKIIQVVVQREPERRIFVIMESGRLLEQLFRREGDLDIVAWSTCPTDGFVERGCVLPRNDEDRVYFITRRQDSAGNWERHIEELGTERRNAPDDFGHLDACLRYELEKPDTTAQVSGTSGTITVTAGAASTFVGGDVGATIWINGGKGEIASYVSGTEITVDVKLELDTDDVAPAGTWGYNQAVTTLTGATHLANQSVKLFGDHKDLGTFTVDGSGEIDFSTEIPGGVSYAYAGKGYTSRWKSLKLSYGGTKGTALMQPKAIKGLALALYEALEGLRYGFSRNGLGYSKEKTWPVNLKRGSQPLDEPLKLFSGESDDLGFDGGFDPDARLLLQIEDAGPCSVAGIVPRIETRDR